MNMKISILSSIVALLISSQFVFAQAPGYLGKRTIIYYDYSASPAVTGNAIPYDYSKKSEKGIGNVVRGYHQATLEYAVSRNRSLNVSYFIHRGGYGTTTESLAANQESTFSRNYRSQSIALSTKKYKVKLDGYRTDEGGIAPIGRYFEPKIFVTFATDEDRRTDDNTVITSEQKMYYGASITWGRHVIIGKVILNFGMEMGFIRPFQGEETFLEAIVPEIPITAFREIARHHAVGFHVGIGYPLF